MKALEWLTQKKVIVFGCGGIGSEVLKLFRAICMPKNLTVVDFDKVELSNLNRQFIYTRNDQGFYKAEVMGRKIECGFVNTTVEKFSPDAMNSFDVAFSCVDSISSRMEINLLFQQSKCRTLIDCGVEGLRAHVKRVDKDTACLYCIKDLYTITNEPHLCTLTNLDQKINESNCEKYLQSMVLKEKGRLADDHGDMGSEYTKDSVEECIIRVVDTFNNLAPEYLSTSYFEVSGLFKDIIPNVCTINSICATMALHVICSVEDFIYYDGTNKPYFRKLIIEIDKECILCKKTSK